MSKLDECLDHFMKALTEPHTVPPWSEWWAVNQETVETVFSLHDWVRLKHRRLLGARQILVRLGRLPKNYVPISMATSGTCPDCGDRVAQGATECAVCATLKSRSPLT